MASVVKYNNLSFDLAGRHFEGRQVVHGIALGLAVTAIYGLRRFFVGGMCYLQKDLTGKNVVITGANVGIGRETAQALVKLGANVYMGSRDQKKNRDVVQKLSKIGKGKVVSYRLDLADKASIQVFANNIKRQLIGQPIHYLINNAGVMAIHQHKLTRDNLEMQIGVNHFGHFYLTYLLWDKIKQSPNPRIINLSSMAHMSPSKSYDIDFSNIHYQNGGYDSFAAYSHSKKANILFTKQLQRKMNQQKINGIAVAVHPGSVRTELTQTYLNTWWRKALVALVYPIILFTFKTAYQGSQTTMYCVLEDDQKLLKGGYYADCKIAKTKAAQVQDRQAARKLWLQSEKAFGIKFNV